MKTKTKQILTVLNVVSWVIFIGLCIKTGAIIFTFIYSFFNPIVAQNLHLGLNLSNLYQVDISIYSYILSCLIILSGLKAYNFFLVVKIFQTINFHNPFEIRIASLIAKISYISFSIWILTFVINVYIEWLTTNGIEILQVNLQNYLGGGSEFFFLGMIVFIISQIFKRGIELQSENELTV